MNKQEIFDKLTALPQFVEPVHIETINGDLNEDWLRLYDVSTYRMISINDSVVQYNWDNGIWFDLAGQDLKNYLVKQEKKGQELASKLPHIAEYNLEDTLLTQLSSITHLQAGSIQKDDTAFPEEYTYFVNTNNNGILCANPSQMVVSFETGSDTPFFANDQLIKVLQFENALSANPYFGNKVKVESEQETPIDKKIVKPSQNNNVSDDDITPISDTIKSKLKLSI